MSTLFFVSSDHFTHLLLSWKLGFVWPSQQWHSPFFFFLMPVFVKCMANGHPVNRFLHLSSVFLQSCNGPPVSQALVCLWFFHVLISGNKDESSLLSPTLCLSA